MTSAPTSAVWHPTRSRAALTGTALTLALLGIGLFSTMVGQFPITPAEVLASVAGRLGSLFAPAAGTPVDGIVWDVRLPRIAAAAVVGAALAVAGAITQGLFGNPLAEPGVIGITSGASLGAAIAIVTTTGAAVAVVVPAAAFVSGLLTTAVVVACASRLGSSMTIGLILVGIAVNAVAGAASSLTIFFAETTHREAIIFWQLGSLNGSTWTGLWPGAVAIAVGLAAAMPLASGLDRLVLGERGAAHLGLQLSHFRLRAVMSAAVLSAGAVSIGGSIGFLGLVVPHLLRLFVGPSHRTLLPLSALAGAVLLSLADLGARTLIPFVDLPIGVLTALLGGPVFFLLIRTTMKGQP